MKLPAILASSLLMKPKVFSRTTARKPSTKTGNLSRMMRILLVLASWECTLASSAATMMASISTTRGRQMTRPILYTPATMPASLLKAKPAASTWAELTMPTPAKAPNWLGLRSSQWPMKGKMKSASRPNMSTTAMV